YFSSSERSACSTSMVVCCGNPRCPVTASRVTVTPSVVEVDQHPVEQVGVAALRGHPGPQVTHPLNDLFGAVLLPDLKRLHRETTRFVLLTHRHHETGMFDLRERQRLWRSDRGNRSCIGRTGT